MEEHEVHPVPHVVHADPLLPRDEGETRAELEQERLQVADESLLEVGFAVLVLQVEELQQVRRSDLLSRRDGVPGPRGLPPLEHQVLPSRRREPLVELGADLPVELADRPASPCRLLLVECAGVVALDGHEPDVVRPGERKVTRKDQPGRPCCGENCRDGGIPGSPREPRS